MSSTTFVTKTNDRLRLASIAAFVYLASTTVFAQAGALDRGAGDVTGTNTVITAFLNNIGTILTGASVVVVTIAIIFAGYQIAFNNKRITDVAPVLIGGLIIGVAGQLASMLVGARP